MRLVVGSGVRGLARVLGIAGTVVILAWPTAGAAQARRGAATPWDRHAQRLSDEVVRRGRGADAVVPLIELGSLFEVAPERTLALLHGLGQNRRLVESVRAYARFYEAALLRRAGRLDEAARISGELGFVRRWRVLGPFDNEGQRGFATAMPPERALDRETDLGEEHAGVERAIRWQTLPALGPGDSVPLTAFVTPRTNVCVFAETFVEIDRARPLALLAGATGALRVYWNGAQVLEDPAYREVDGDRVAALVAGRAGWNRVLVKVCGMDAGLELMLRVAGADGAPLGTQGGLPADPSGARVAAPASPVQLPSAGPVTILAALEAAVAARPDDAVAHESLARYLAYTGGEEESQSRVRDLAMRATELRATPRNLIFAARQQPARADRMRLIGRAVALAPQDPEVRFEHASLVAGGASGERALRLLEAITPDSTSGLSAMALRAALLGNLGLNESRRALLESLTERVPGAPAYLRALAAAEQTLGHITAARALHERLLTICADDSAVRRLLVGEAVARSDTRAAVAMIHEELAFYPTSAPTMFWAASVFDALASESEALEALRRAAELDPHDARARVELGRMLLRLDRRAPALAALREALALRPQDAATRLLVEQIEPEPRSDEAYATPLEDVLARRRPDGEWPASVLHDLEVHTVHESGLASSFRQLVVQIHDREGARANRTHAIRYEPGSQWVDVRSARVHRGGTVLTSYQLGERSLAEPAYRIYYSARDVLVTLPVLEPGDVLELRYRVEDVAARNAYAGYFGTLRGLQRATPTARLEHVFITPAAREVFFNTPSLALAHDERVEGDRRIHRFVADGVPPLRGEPSMPGYAEVAPYLHASTYPTWEAVGRFFWGLAQEQLHPDAALERTVSELIAGTTDVRERVQRIFAWATDRVRYVGLEFGIHGHQPYRVADVVRRGFGDCKDTAALLYAMLRLASIDARIALVRTRSNGEIGGTPASLAVFDHAIAYVPELDLFLDGTAEHAGSTELPSMDQGAMALVVGPSSAELVTMPMRAADASGRRRAIRIELASSGAATLTAEEELRGDEAMQARGTYDAPGTRRERLGAALGSLFPGIELTQEAFEGFDDRERPVRYTWAASVPRIGEREGEIVRIAPSILGGLTRAWAPLPTRRHALVLGAPSHYRERRAIALRSFRAEDVPAGGVAESPFGRLAVRYETRADEVVAETELTLTRERITADEYPRFRAWVESADALLRQRIAIGGLE